MTDESGNPIGLLLPASDPMPSEITNLMAAGDGIGIPASRDKIASDIMALNAKTISEVGMQPDFSNPKTLDILNRAKTESEKKMLMDSGADFPTNGIVLDIGGNLIITDGKGALPIIRFHDKIVLSICTSAAGSSISGEFFDRNQNIQAEVVSNKFTLDRPNFWKSLTQDKSTLIITDHQNLEALSIRFCNPHLFKISGVFHFQDGTEVVVTNTNYSYKGQVFRGQTGFGTGGIGINSNGTIQIGAGENDEIKPANPINHRLPLLQFN